MVGEHDDADFCFLSALQNLGASALGVVGVLGVDMEDGSEILIDARRGRRGGASFHPCDTLRVNGGEMRGVESLYRSPGEEESGEDQKSEETHTFILRGYSGFACGGMMNTEIAP
jgi:hypothetical protein